jgi:hypothetical protein
VGVEKLSVVADLVGGLVACRFFLPAF